ncbi:ABC transporter permease [Occultella gossypii]|uniref:Transport permease protein n=1 Tax=Occultella gossypii TaxID=2800820 RepID=A0ABS7S7D4_9MICO|nr:ABC transporter permease [Occultella gossypii]MBZ2196266.1 ABC transporter permease [Occultella gossypii]
MTALIAAPPSAPARLPLGTEERTFIARSMRHTVRNVESLLMAVVLPVMLMLLFVYVFGTAISPDGQYVTYVVPGIILLCAGFGASSTGVDVANDSATGFMDRLRTMPVRSSAVITGHVVASLARNLAATAIVIGVALAIGFRPTATVGEWVAAIALVALYILTITYLFAAIGLASGNPEAANGYGFILLFLPYLSSAFVPTETLPNWLRGVAEHQPITPVIESIRGLLTGVESGNAPLVAVAWCVGIIVAAVAWSTIMFRRKAGRR